MEESTFLKAQELKTQMDELITHKESIKKFLNAESSFMEKTPERIFLKLTGVNLSVNLNYLFENQKDLIKFLSNYQTLLDEKIIKLKNEFKDLK